MRSVGLLLTFAFLAAARVGADTVLLGDISYQPDTPITGLDSIFLDNFTDLPDLGCSITYPACSGLAISGTLNVTYQDALGNTQNALVTVDPAGPGSTSIYEFDPALITFESAVLTGTVSPSTFTLGDGSTFISSGTFVSDILTPDVGFGSISVEGNGASAVPEPAWSGLVAMSFLTLAAILSRRRLT